MDVVNDVQVLENIEVLETDVKDCDEKMPTCKLLCYL